MAGFRFPTFRSVRAHEADFLNCKAIDWIFLTLLDHPDLSPDRQSGRITFPNSATGHVLESRLFFSTVSLGRGVNGMEEFAMKQIRE
jgi:hypothetical protein